MQKTFNAFEKATVKNSAKAVAHYQAKNEAIYKKIKDLEAEKEMNNAYIEQYSVPVRELTGGYNPLELCEKVSRGSQNDWVFKYPTTIVPPVQAEAETEEKKEEGEKEEKEEQASTVENSIEEETPMLEGEQLFGEDPFAEEQEEFPAQEDEDRFNPDEF
jgi:hypothetical protein